VLCGVIVGVLSVGTAATFTDLYQLVAVLVCVELPGVIVGVLSVGTAFTVTDVK
jgi:hypothetical protein